MSGRRDGEGIALRIGKLKQPAGTRAYEQIQVPLRPAGPADEIHTIPSIRKCPLTHGTTAATQSSGDITLTALNRMRRRRFTVARLYRGRDYFTVNW